MKVIDNIVNLAKNELGYLEKASNSFLDNKINNAGSNNFTKYARDLDLINYFNGPKNGYPWCACFVNWLLVKLYDRETALRITGQPNRESCGAECTFLMNYFKEKKQFYTVPKVGDFILFTKDNKTSYHVGLVVSINNTTVTTIEGNTSNGRGVIDNGGMVCQKSYSINSPYIIGYGRPKYIEFKIEVDEVIENKIYTINGKDVNIDTIFKDGKNYIEVRGITEALDVDIEYDEETKKVKLNTSIETIKMKVNGVIKNVNSILIRGNNFIKLRDLEDSKIAIGYNEQENLPTLEIK